MCVSFIPSSHLCQRGADPSPVRSPPPPPYRVTRGHCLNCVVFLYFLRASPVPLSPQRPRDLPSPRWSPSSSRPSPSLLNSLLTLLRRSCSLRVILIMNKCDLDTPSLRASLWRVTSHRKMAAIFIHDLGPRYKLMPSAPGRQPFCPCQDFPWSVFPPPKLFFLPHGINT